MKSRVDSRLLLWLAIAAYSAGFGALSILRHRAFNSGRFDLGNMVQAVWATAHGHPLRVTDLDGRQVSRLGSHFDPILVAFAPLWRVWPSPSLLLTVQAVVLALGALPVFWLAREALASERAALALALAYLLYPPIQWLALDDFHAVALAPTLLLFALWFLLEDRLIGFCAFALAAVTTREEVGLAVAGLGLYQAVGRHRWRSGAAIAVLGSAATALTLALVIPHFNAGGSSDFYRRYSDVGGSPGGVIRTAFTDPGRLLSVAFDRRGLEYLAELLLPLAGLWLFAPLLLLAAAPQLALNLLSRTSTQTSIHFHYTAAVIPGVVAASVLGAARLARHGRAGTVGALAVAVALLANYRLGAVPLWRYVPGGQTLQARASHVSRHDTAAAAALRLVPADAVVSASNSLGAHLSARRRILSFPRLADATWIAIDTTKPSYLDRANAPGAMRKALDRLRGSPLWRTVFRRDGILILRRR